MMRGYQAWLGLAVVLVVMEMPVTAQPTRPSIRLSQTSHLEQVNALNQRVIELYEARRYGEAISIAEEVLSILRQQLGDSHPDVAASLSNLATLYQGQGRYVEAEPLFLEALQIRRQQFGGNHIAVSNSLNNLAELYRNQGRYVEAEPLFLEALQISRAQRGGNHPSMAANLNNLAELYRNQGRYVEAEPLFLEALQILRQQLGDSHSDVAIGLNNLALLYRDQGRYVEAEPLFLEALQIRRQQLGGSHPSVANSLSNLATLYRDQGRYVEAEPLLLEALRIQETALGPEHPDVALNLNNLAALHYTQGRYVEAEPLLLGALRIQETALGPEHPDVAPSLSNLAALYQGQGRYVEAEPLFLEALRIQETALGPEHPDVALGLNNIAALYQHQGRYVEAVRYLARGLEIQEQHLDDNLVFLADAQRQAYVATISGSTDQALSLNLQSTTTSDATQLALATLLHRKGRIQDAGTSSWQRLRQNLSASDQVTFDEFTALRQELARLTFNPPVQLSPVQYRAELNRLETAANQLERQLARRSAAFRAETQPVDIATVQAQLPADGVLVEYVRYRPFDATNASAPWGAPRYAVYLLFPDGDIEAVDLGAAAEIDTTIQAFSLRLRDITQSPSVAARALSEQIFDPLQPYLTGREHLLISPDSQLNRIPFEALRTTDNRYLIQDYQISYLNSGRDLLKFDVTEPSQQPAVIVANPDYEVADTSIQIASTRSSQRSVELSQLEFGPLPGTAAEAEAIHPLLPNAVVLTESAATENAIKQVQAPEILHIATHGFFLENVARPEVDNSRGVAVVAGDSPVTRPASVAVENPLLRSGLALAGFNERASGNEDGVLTALEASQLNLFGTQLVVLSACETGLGDIANGEGVYGLRRAFAIAGAETQLMSLWQVDDFGTQSLMARYYENLTAGMGRGEALRQVQLELINSQGRYAHPFYWAAFITTGFWQPLE
jgi:CHAT domain-containing protein